MGRQHGKCGPRLQSENDELTKRVWRGKCGPRLSTSDDVDQTPVASASSSSQHTKESRSASAKMVWQAVPTPHVKSAETKSSVPIGAKEENTHQGASSKSSQKEVQVEQQHNHNEKNPAIGEQLHSINRFTRSRASAEAKVWRPVMAPYVGSSGKEIGSAAAAKEDNRKSQASASSWTKEEKAKATVAQKAQKAEEKHTPGAAPEHRAQDEHPTAESRDTKRTWSGKTQGYIWKPKAISSDESHTKGKQAEIQSSNPAKSGEKKDSSPAEPETTSSKIKEPEPEPSQSPRTPVDCSVPVESCLSALQDYCSLDNSLVDGGDFANFVAPRVADESLPGPDGALYEIFYPPDCVNDDRYENSTTDFTGDASSDVEAERSGHATPTDSEYGFGESISVDVGRSASSSSSKAGYDYSYRQSADAAMEHMVRFMSASAVARYPARMKLFERVRAAAKFALGPYFQRFSLVGSTALRIDTPESDLDAVVFTKPAFNVKGEKMPPPMQRDTLRRIADSLSCDNSFIIQLVECTRVPVLTILTPDGILSLDLTADQALSEGHVLWFRSQYAKPANAASCLQSVPTPSHDGWGQGLEAAALRCIKWWLRRRRIPVPKEGGYPSIVWTLLVLHVLRCSVFVDSKDESSSRGQQLLRAIVAFFDRFAEGGLAGRVAFGASAGDQQDAQAEPAHTACLSVLDPTTTSEESKSSGVDPVELVPHTSSATLLLYSYELRRAQRLSAVALAGVSRSDGSNTSSAEASSAALQEVFEDAGGPINTLPASLSASCDGVLVLHEGSLTLGVLHKIDMKPLWQAPFLHRQDACSKFALRRAHVDHAGRLVRLSAPEAVEWFYPEEFVCMMPFLCDVMSSPQLAPESSRRWQEMRKIISHSTRGSSSRACSPEQQRTRCKRLVNKALDKETALAAAP